jgi:hypothetical protein
MKLTRRTAIGAGAAAMAAACAPQKATAQAPCWRTEKPLPFPVQEIYPAAHKGRIHVAGGLLAENGRVTGVSDRHVAWDPKTGASTTLAALPWKRHHPQLISHGGKLYLLGGFATDPTRVTWTASTETLVHDDAKNTWSPLASSPEPHAECVAASIGSRIHIVGGRKPRGEANAAYGDQEDVTRQLVFDPAANKWSTAAPALTARNSAAGAMIGGLWHVAGGRSMTGGPSDAHEVYDPKADKWRNAAPMPKGTGAGGNAAVALDGSLYVFGGEFFAAANNTGGVHNSVWRYDPKADAWTRISEMPTPRHGLGAVVIGDAGYLVGGAKRPSGVDTSDAVERFSLGGC